MVLDTKRHLKYSFMNPSMSPDLAIIDPMLTVGMPPRPSAVVGLDVLCHATENLLGAQQNDYSDLLMLECIKRVWKWLPVVFAEPGNIEGRSQMSWASTNAQANGGVPQGHAIGHAIGAAYSVTHRFPQPQLRDRTCRPRLCRRFDGPDRTCGLEPLH